MTGPTAGPGGAPPLQPNPRRGEESVLEGIVLRRLSSPWVGPLLVAAVAAMGLAVLDDLPERVPTHWAANGRPNGWMSPLAAITFMPVFMLGLWVLLLGIPRVVKDFPRSGPQWRAYVLLTNTIMVFMVAVHATVLGAAVGVPLNPGRWAIPLIGGLFVAIGLLMPHMPDQGINLPIRDPDYIQRLGERLSKTFLWGGIVIAAAGIVLPATLATWVGFWLIMLVSFLPLAYIGLRPPPTRRPPGGWRKVSTPDKESKS